MAEQFPELTDGLIRFINNQHIYFTGTARASGRVNVSPKGTDSLKVLSPRRIVWQNLTGSGNETASHLLENDRMTLMFCSFDKKPLILRVYGNAHAVHPRDAAWPEYVAQFPENPGTRQFFVLDIDLVQTSCGFAVPLMNHVADRDTLDNWAAEQGRDGIEAYWARKNALSLDGFETGIFE